MGSLFSKKKEPEPVKPKITEQDKAVLALKQQRDKLILYRKKIQLNIEKETQLAKQLLEEGNENKAKLLLKKKRYQEQTLERTDNQLENLEKMVQAVELGEIQIQVADRLKQGNEALKKVVEESDELLSGSLTKKDEYEMLQETEMIRNFLMKNSTEVPTEDPPGYALSLGLAND